MSDDKNILVFEGVILHADTPTPNGRIYPKEVLEKAIQKFQADIEKNGERYGELMPDMGVPELELTNVSHKIHEVWMDGNVAKASVEPLNTEMGKHLKNLLQLGPVRLAPRALGKIRVAEEGSVVEEFELLSVDVVEGEPKV